MEKELVKVYLAVPYSKWDMELSYQVANEVTIILLNQGYNVFSPITHSHPLVLIDKYEIPHTWEYWQRIDFQFMDWADMLYVVVPDGNMDLIDDSVGVTAEIEYAMKTGKGIKFYEFSTKDLLISK